MAAPVNANINVLVNTQQAMAQLRALQGQVASLNSSISATSGAAAAQQAALAKGLKDSANASRMWQARIVPMNTATQQFSEALDKGRMSLGQYTRYAASQLPGMSRVFKREFEMMNRVATQNVKQMQTQYVQLANSATGAAQAMALTPTALNKHASAAAVAAQRQMMMNRMIDLGTTKLLNWGKNTQWAGRQLMVGFSIPLAMVGAVAAKAFKEIDKGSIAFRRVYGDLSTTTAEMERNLDAVKALGNEYTKYGLKLSETIELAADVAATGAKNESLMAATEQTLRLATLGLMEYGEALEATVALQTAFQVSNEDLAGTIDFLNVVENETILTMQDMAAAIPRVAPVVKGLGGDVKDLAVFMTAMREGGVTAEQGANALKSGLGRLINPTKAAREVMAGFGMSIDAIIQSNRGDLMGMMQEFGQALSVLGDFEQQQVLEKVFGKYQYARLGALFKNLSNDASQANRTIELTNMSMEDLAAISERELSKIEEATSTKFQAAVERLKVSIAPIGEQFMKALMPVIDFVTKIANKFNDLPEGIKNAIAIGVAAIAGIGPVVLMTVGLIANGIANIGKLIQTVRKFFARLRGDSALFNYLTQQEREASLAANALGGATDALTGKFLGQRRALESLITMVGRYATALSSAAAAAPIGFGMGTPAAVRNATARGTVVTGPRARGTVVTGPSGLPMAKGGVVPGTGNKDTIPAMLTPGESVVTKEATQKYGPMIQAMNAGLKIPGFIDGVTSVGQATSQSGTRTQFQSQSALIAGHLGGGMLLPVKQELARVEANIGAFSSSYVAHLRALDAAGQQHVRVYSNLVALMSQELNEDIKNGQANIARVKAEIGNPAAQIELKRQLQLLGMQDDEIAQVLNRYVTNLNAQLDAAQARLGTGNLSAAQMDRALQRAAVAAANRTFTDPAQRSMFARLATEPTTYLPAEGKGRRTMQSRSASRSNPEMRSYTALRRSYGIRAATKFSNDDIAAAGYNPQAMQKVFAGMPAAAQQAIIATKGNLEKALPIFREHGLKAGVAYNEGMVGAISTGKPNVSQAVSKNRQAASPAPWAAPMGKQDGGAYGKGFTSAAATEAAKIKQSILGMSGGKPGGLPPAQQALAQGTRVKPQGFPASVYNPANNPAGLGLTGEARAARGFAGAIESRTAVHRRAQAQEEAMLAEQNKFRVVDRRLTGVKQQAAVVIGEEVTWLEKQSLATQKLAQQRALNEAALKAEQEAQARLTGATQRAAVMQETMNQRPARGGMLDRPLGLLRKVAFPGGQDAALKNLGFNQFTGQVKTAGQLIIESAQNIKARVAGSLRTLPSDFKLATQQLIGEARSAGTALRSDFKSLGTTIKTNMQVDLDNVRRTAVNAAGAIGRLARAAGGAAQRMASGVGNFMTAVDQNGVSRMQKFGKAGNASIMGLMGLSMAASFAGGEVGEMAQKVLPVTMGLMGLQMILPMLTNPIGLAVIATSALVAGFIYLRKQLDDAAKDAAQFGANIGGVANGMKVLEDATGFVAPKLQDRLFRFSEEDRQAMSEFSSYFESDAGSQFIEDLQEATSEERYQQVAYLIAQGIATGLDPEKAEAFGNAIAEATGDSLLAANLSKDFASGFFKEGSQALIDLAGGRLGMAPEIGNVARQRAARSGESLLDQQRRTREEAFQSLSIWQQAIDSTTGIMSALGGVLRGRGTQDLFMPFTEGKMAEELVAESAKGLGFALQVLQDITNAEAVLAEERRSGVVDYEEAQKRQAELDALRDKTQDYFRTVIENGADSGAMLQAFGDQLSFRGFSEDQIGRITETFSPDALAERFFDADYSKLDDAQKQYVDEVFSKTMSGLDPDNVAQRLQDVEGRWSEIAKSVLNAMRAGADVDIGAAFTQAGFEDALSNRPGVGRQTTALQAEGKTLTEQKDKLQQEMDSLLDDIVAAEKEGNETLKSSLIKQRNAVVQEWESVGTRIKEVYGELADIDPAKSISENLTKAEVELDQLGLTTEEVGTRFLEFTDDEFMKRLGRTKDGFVRLGEAIKYVGDTGLNLESVMKYIEENPAERSAEGLSKAMKDIGEIKLDKKIFGKQAYIDVDQLTQGLMDLGIEVEDMAPRVQEKVNDAVSNIGSLGEKVKNKFGNIPINVDTVVKLFGTDQGTAEGLSNALEGAFPQGISPIEVPLLLSILNPEMLSALAGMSPEFMEFAKTATAGDIYRTPGMTGSFAAAGRVVTQADIDAANAVGAVQALGFGGKKPPKKKPKGTSTSGGAQEKSFLEQTMEELEANAALYTTTQRAVEKYNKKKANFFGIFQELRKKFGVPEGFIESLGTGAQAVANAVEFIQATKKEREALIQLYKENSVGEQIEALRRDREERKTKAKAIEVLAANGISLEDAKKAAEDSQLAIAIVTAAAEGNKKKLNTLLNLIKTETLAEDAKSPIEQAMDAQKEYAEQQDAMFEQQYKQIEMVAYEEFKARTGMSVEGMELQIKKNEDLIQTYQDEISVINNAIRALETKNGTAADYSDWGLEQLEKEIKSNQENIRALERINELTQRRIDDLKRQDEIRNRESEAISKDLEKLSEAENKIRDSYQQRIDALDKVAKINDHIINQQKQQLDLSKAISEGDIYAATAAAQQMRASSAGFAVDQVRSALEAGMEAEIAGLRTAGGLTREQAEARIQSIKEQSYQTSLNIRKLEDEIYNRQINEILPLRDKEYNLNLAAEKVQNTIAAKQLEIRDIERGKIESITQQNELYREQIDDLLLDIETQQLNVKNAAGQTKDEFERQNGWIMANLTQLEQSTRETGRAAKVTKDLARQWKSVGEQINNAKNALRDAYEEIDLKPLTADYTEAARDAEKADAYSVYEAAVNLALGNAPTIDPSIFDPRNNYAGGLIKKYAMGGIVNPLKYTSNETPPAQKRASGGAVLGEGARDSVAAMLTPGEFVIRKAMVDKYGLPLMEALNQGSFYMPRYNTGPQTPQFDTMGGNKVSNINAPVYNTYDMKFSINGSNQSADEIANKVMFKMKQLQSQGVRSNRGY